MKTYTIKPLKWTGCDPVWTVDYGVELSKGGWSAKVPMGSYSVTARHDGYAMEYCFDEYYNEGCEYADTIAAAKELAWQDWLARLMPALQEVK